MTPERRAGLQDAEDLVNVLVDRVRQISRTAAWTASASVYAVAFAREVFAHRHEYVAALATLRRVEDEDQHDLFLDQVRKAYLRDSKRLTGAASRADLLTEWVALFLDAVGAVQRSFPARPTPFHELLDEDDLAVIAEDRENDTQLSARGISEAWQA